eukprot:m.225690 g.225690  ORF g.225690 m.225690 type:complete len:73 (+) comp11304_c0_seq1:51-269(+)
MAAPENELGARWDRAISRSLIYSAAGLGIGSVLSLVLFKRRGWPIVLGTGFGLGKAFSETEQEFARPLSKSA